MTIENKSQLGLNHLYKIILKNFLIYTVAGS